MGLKGYRLWDMGQFDATCRAPPRMNSWGQSAGIVSGNVRSSFTRE
jgi:hypothetical protein